MTYKGYCASFGYQPEDSRQLPGCAVHQVKREGRVGLAMYAVKSGIVTINY